MAALRCFSPSGPMPSFSHSFFPSCSPPGSVSPPLHARAHVFFLCIPLVHFITSFLPQSSSPGVCEFLPQYRCFPFPELLFIIQVRWTSPRPSSTPFVCSLLDNSAKPTILRLLTWTPWNPCPWFFLRSSRVLCRSRRPSLDALCRRSWALLFFLIDLQISSPARATWCCRVFFSR